MKQNYLGVGRSLLNGFQIAKKKSNSRRLVSSLRQPSANLKIKQETNEDFRPPCAKILNEKTQLESFFHFQRPFLAVKKGPFKEYLLKYVPTLEVKYWPTFWCFESRAQTVSYKKAQN